MNLENCYLIFGEDFKNRNWIDWVKSHISLAPPPYRFHGEISLDHDGILFQGMDDYKDSDTEFKIKKDSITQLYHGYDEVFNRYQTRDFGMSYAPIRMQIEKGNEEMNHLYVISNYNGVTSSNLELFETLKTWLS